MDLRINEVTSNVYAADRSTFLTPEMLREIVDAVMQELGRRKEQDRSAEDERTPSRSVAPRPWSS